MKNLLIVFTVLAMASVTNAALLLSVDGVVDPPETAITLLPSETAVIDIWGDSQTPTPQAMYLASSKESCDMILDAAGLQILYGGSLSEYYQVEDPDEKGYISELIGGGPVCSAIFIVLADGGAPPQPPLDGTLVDGIILHCAAPDLDGVLYLVEANGAGIFDTQVIHQVPEPITFALLGLGGLFLRRRK